MGGPPLEFPLHDHTQPQIWDGFGSREAASSLTDSNGNGLAVVVNTVTVGSVFLSPPLPPSPLCPSLSYSLPLSPSSSLSLSLSLVSVSLLRQEEYDGASFTKTMCFKQTNVCHWQWSWVNIMSFGQMLTFKVITLKRGKPIVSLSLSCCNLLPELAQFLLFVRLQTKQPLSHACKQHHPFEPCFVYTTG